MIRLFALPLTIVALAAVRPPTASAAAISGTVVDVATYITHDHNMDAMHGSMAAMKHDSMGAMKGRAHPCPPALGLTTNGGLQVFLLATQIGSTAASALCAKLDKTATIDGTVYEKGGMRVLLVSAVK